MNTSVGFSEIPGWLWAVIAVIWLVEVALAIYALVVLFRTPEERVVAGKRWIWALLILFVSLIGPIVFLIAGRKPAEAADPLAQGAPAAPAADRATRAADVLYGAQEGGGAEGPARPAEVPEVRTPEVQTREGEPQ